MLLPKTTCGGLWIGCGIAAVCTTTSQPASDGVRGAGVGEIGLPVVLGLAGLDAIPRSGSGRSREPRSPPPASAGTSARPTLPCAPVTRTASSQVRHSVRRRRRRGRAGSRGRSPRWPAGHGPHGACGIRARPSAAGGTQAARRAASSASSTTRSRRPLRTSSRIRSPSSTSASGPPTADSGEQRGARRRRTRCRSCARRRCAEVAHALLEELRRDRQVSPLRHPRRLRPARRCAAP